MAGGWWVDRRREKSESLIRLYEFASGGLRRC